LHKHVECRKEKHDRLLAQCKLEKVQEKLAEAWPEIRKVAPDLPEASEIREPEQQIELLQEGMDTTRYTH
jgi:hypothetical protein